MNGDDALFELTPTTPPPALTTPVVGAGSCPWCGTTVLIGCQGRHLAWGVHDYETQAGTRRLCQTSGQRLCELHDTDNPPPFTCHKEQP